MYILWNPFGKNLEPTGPTNHPMDISKVLSGKPVERICGNLVGRPTMRRYLVYLVRTLKATLS